MLSLIKRLFGAGRGKPPRQRAARARTAKPAAKRSSANSGTPGGERAPDSPGWRVDTPQDTGFDPYNTGTFNRSGSWERINKRRNA